MVSLRLLHRIVTALAWRTSGALDSISKLELRMWGGGLSVSTQDGSEKVARNKGGHNSELKETRNEERGMTTVTLGRDGGRPSKRWLLRPVPPPVLWLRFPMSPIQGTEAEPCNGAFTIRTLASHRRPIKP
jgi:hypothetical protein